MLALALEPLALVLRNQVFDWANIFLTPMFGFQFGSTNF
jgi:hypothetical protein